MGAVAPGQVEAQVKVAARRQDGEETPLRVGLQEGVAAQAAALGSHASLVQGRHERPEARRVRAALVAAHAGATTEQGGVARRPLAEEASAPLNRQAAEILAQITVPGLPRQGVHRRAAAPLVVGATAAVLPPVVPILAVEAVLGEAVHREGATLHGQVPTVPHRTAREVVDPTRSTQPRLFGVRQTADVEPQRETEVARPVEVVVALAVAATERHVQVGAGQVSVRQGAAPHVLIRGAVAAIGAEATARFPPG